LEFGGFSFDTASELVIRIRAIAVSTKAVVARVIAVGGVRVVLRLAPFLGLLRLWRILENEWH